MAAIVEFRSVVDAVSCAIEIQRAMVERNAEVARDKRIEFRIGIHLGDVVEESDGDLMGDGVNIAARLEGISKPGAICLSEDAYRQVKGRLDLAVTDLGAMALKNIAEPMRAYSVEVGKPATAPKPKPAPRSRLCSGCRRACGAARCSGGRGRMVFDGGQTRGDRCVFGARAGGPFRPPHGGDSAVRQHDRQRAIRRAGAAHRPEDNRRGQQCDDLARHKPLGRRSREHHRPDRRRAAVERRLCRRRKRRSRRGRAACGVPGR